MNRKSRLEKLERAVKIKKGYVIIVYNSQEELEAEIARIRAEDPDIYIYCTPARETDETKYLDPEDLNLPLRSPNNHHEADDENDLTNDSGDGSNKRFDGKFGREQVL